MHLAGQYRQAAASIASRPTSTPVVTNTGTMAGHIYVYQGIPPWAVVALTAAPEPGAYTMTVETTDGRRYTAGICTVTGRTGTAAYPLKVPLARIAAIELTRPGIELTAHR